LSVDSRTIHRTLHEGFLFIFDQDDVGTSKDPQSQKRIERVGLRGRTKWPDHLRQTRRNHRHRYSQAVQDPGYPIDRPSGSNPIPPMSRHLTIESIQQSERETTHPNNQDGLSAILGVLLQQIANTIVLCVVARSTRRIGN
jgi:hypothetical protein